MQRTWRVPLIRCSSWLACLLSYTPYDRLPGHTEHPHQENAPQACPQANLIETSCQLRFHFQNDPGLRGADQAQHSSLHRSGLCLPVTGLEQVGLSNTLTIACPMLT